jgi:hypothetical protein
MFFQYDVWQKVGKPRLQGLFLKHTLIQFNYELVKYTNHLMNLK